MNDQSDRKGAVPVESTMACPASQRLGAVVVSRSAWSPVGRTRAVLRSGQLCDAAVGADVGVGDLHGRQTAGDLNVVVVGWNDATAIVNSVTDSKGNVYTRAVGPTTVSGTLSQSIYYAKNIVAAASNANVVTVRFNVAAQFADIRVLEYSGLDPVNPVDVVAAATGTGTTSSTPAATTTNANDLIFGANTVTSLTTGSGTGFTTRVITTPDGDIAEDRIVTAVGSYSASAPMASGTWIMQMVAFKAAGGVPDVTPPTPPTNLTATAVSSSQINLSWTASTDNVGVTGYLLERCQGAGCTSFAQIATPTGTTYNDTGRTANTSYSYRVRATDAVPNLSGYSNTASATTLSAGDTTPPSAPTNLTATAVSSSQINLSWTASTDNVAVTGYLLERCQGAGLHELRPDRDPDGHDVQRYRPHGEYQLQLSRAGDRRRPQPQRLLQHRERHDARGRATRRRLRRRPISPPPRSRPRRST